MTTLVDTSVWSLLLRKRGPTDHWAVRRLTRLIEHRQRVALTGVILQEILAYFRSDEVAASVAVRLRPFPLLEPTRADHESAAALFRHARAHGVAATTVDCLIASVAASHDAELLTTDGDFARLVPLAGIRLTPPEE
ncbi:MAG: PIN domain-containing protein [Deltaproteobacteria bacterium]|nr:PIN domain-containing protein [Deltaproteobacteria bacterium]